MRYVKGLIVGLRYFFKEMTPADREQLIEDIQGMGFEKPVEVFKSNTDGWEDNFPANRLLFFKKTSRS